ncbi:MAG: UDP-N-acetylmuramoyl-L-alanyl-D-glutamate--2,6-diaminopimelate ligase [Proteobacteria bacterium]|nr:UDP-N-acetylmuramoyl-L-alanyl-D-glutamate--2,6-diaminopimelate ligase [Pseudomonadota bacterium]
MTRALHSVAEWIKRHAPQAQLTADSRAIRRGDVFFAYPGEVADGRQFIAQAIESGAAAVVCEADAYVWDDAQALPHLAVRDLKDQVGVIANDFYGHPDREMFIVAVTGTNGKTSCTQWLGSALSHLGYPTGVIGTLGVGVYRSGVAESFEATGYTTPDALLLQRRLADMRSAGVQALAIEASSIGLQEQRMQGMHVDVAVFTNLTRDHLDYHGDMAAYEQAKTMLFDWPGLKHAVLNLDDAAGLRIAQKLRASQPTLPITGVSIEGKNADGAVLLQASEIRASHSGTTFHLQAPGAEMQVKTQLVGRFNVGNVLAIIGALLAKGIDARTAIDAVEALVAVPGRMQQLGGQDAPLVVIDYAHTPDALEKVLAALEPIAQEREGELWCVVGCGGDRDAGKRPQIGKAALLADHVIVTSDNPRSEEPAAIIAQIMQGMGEVSGLKYAPQVIEDRAAAILSAIKHAGKNDVVLLAGKGHETTQEIRGRKLPFLDADHAALALAARPMQGGH